MHNYNLSENAKIFLGCDKGGGEIFLLNFRGQREYFASKFQDGGDILG